MIIFLSGGETVAEFFHVSDETPPNKPKNEPMKYAVINTMTAYDTTVGTVLSTHRTIEAAEQSDRLTQKSIRRYSPTSYLPTIIREVSKATRKGDRIHESDILETADY